MHVYECKHQQFVWWSGEFVGEVVSLLPLRVLKMAVNAFTHGDILLVLGDLFKGLNILANFLSPSSS